MENVVHLSLAVVGDQVEDVAVVVREILQHLEEVPRLGSNPLG